MKTVSNVFGITGAAAVLVGSAFKFAHWPFANILLLLGTACLGLGYLPLLLSLSLKQTDRTLSKVRNFVGYLSGIALMIGFLFKIMHWPWANIISLFAIGTFLLVFLPLYIATFHKESAFKISPVPASVLVIVTACVLFSYTIPKSSSSYHRAVERVNHNLETSYQSNHNRLLMARQQSEATEGTTQGLSKAADELVAYIDGFKANLVSILGAKEEATSNQLPERYMMTYRVKTTDPIFSPGKNAPTYNGKRLKERIQGFLATLPAKAVSNETIPPILNLEDTDWLEENFLSQPLFAIFNNLTLIQLEATNLEIASMQLS